MGGGDSKCIDAVTGKTITICKNINKRVNCKKILFSATLIKHMNLVLVVVVEVIMIMIIIIIIEI